MGSLPRLASALAAAFLLAGCDAATSTGFEADPPAGWKDSTQTAESRSGTDFQAVYEGPREGGVASSVAIVRVKAPSSLTLEQVARTGRDNVRKAYGAISGAGTLEPAKLAGARAVRLDYETPEGRVRQIAALRSGHVYLVTFSAAPGAFDQRVRAFDGVLRSWRWE